MYYVITTTTVLRPFFRDHPDEPVPEENFGTLWKINRGRHTDHSAGHHSIWTNQCPPPPSPHIFYRPDALPAAQPTASKHWRQRVEDKRENYQNCSLPCCVRQLCTMIHMHTYEPLIKMAVGFRFRFSFLCICSSLAYCAFFGYFDAAS